MFIPAEDRIYVDSFQKMTLEINHPNLIHANTDAACELLNAGPEKPSVVVLSYSDFGIVEQERDHPNSNLEAFTRSNVHMMDWEAIGKSRSEYHRLILGPTCKPEKCKMSDRFSMKINRFTEFTFNEVPSNIKSLFTINLNAELDRTQMIPFGLNREGTVTAPIDDFMDRPKKNLMYVNFQDYTADRINLKRRYADSHWATTRLQANVPLLQYLDELSSHKFVLCPYGNGYDSYRLLECMYLGVFPIMPYSHFTRNLLKYDLPVVVVDNLFGLSPELLNNIYGKMKKNFNYEPLRLSYWRTQILRALDEI